MCVREIIEKRRERGRGIGTGAFLRIKKKI